MNTQVTRPGYMVPGWTMAHGFAEAQEAHNRQAERERKAGDKLARWAFGLVIAGLFSGLVWAAIIAASFEAVAELHPLVQASATLAHVL